MSTRRNTTGSTLYLVLILHPLWCWRGWGGNHGCYWPLCWT